MDKFSQYLAAGVIGLIMATMAMNAHAKDTPMQSAAKQLVSEFYGADKIKHAECQANGECEVTDITGDRISLMCEKASNGKYVCTPT